MGLEKKHDPLKYVVIKDMNNGALKNMKKIRGKKFISNYIRFTTRVSTKFYLFTLIMDELTRHIQHEIPWCMLFTDDIIVINESRTLNSFKVEAWRESVRIKGLYNRKV